MIRHIVLFSAKNHAAIDQIIAGLSILTQIRMHAGSRLLATVRATNSVTISTSLSMESLITRRNLQRTKPTIYTAKRSGTCDR